MIKKWPYCKKTCKKCVQKRAKKQLILAKRVILQKAIFLSILTPEMKNDEKWSKSGQKMRFCKNGPGPKFPL